MATYTWNCEEMNRIITKLQDIRTKLDNESTQILHSKRDAMNCFEGEAAEQFSQNLTSDLQNTLRIIKMIDSQIAQLKKCVAYYETCEQTVARGAQDLRYLIS